ncbi:acyltransferase family protein [Knoellia sp. LjRoot47]|uniref:acyltransferase family protein n=1 Tax=Knoellia sp. LjRoot47 TaxID=3342330 RepID=UPI003ECFC981
MTTSTTALAAPRRVLGLDAARGVAVVAMVIAHALPFISSRVPQDVLFVLLQVNDLASPLFALVMGAAAGLVFPGTSASRGIVRAAVRGLALIALGVGLERLDHWVAVILHVLGLLVIVGTPLLVLGSRWLLGLAAVLWLAGPSVIGAVTRAAGGVPGGATPTAGWAGNPLVEWLVLNTHYRVLTLLPLFLIGAVLARRGLDDERASWWCLMGGLAMLWASFAADLLGFPVVFSGDHPDQVQENGLALAAYGLVMATAIAGARHGSRPTVLGPLALVGTVALSLYVVHVALLVPVIPAFPDGGWLPFTAFVVVSVGAAWAWARFVGRGPVEVLLDRVSPARRPRIRVPA